MNPVNYISRHSIQHPKKTILLSFLIIILSGWATGMFYTQSTDENAFFPDNDQVNLLNEVENRFGQDVDVITVIVTLDDDSLSSSNIWNDLVIIESELLSDSDVSKLQKNIFGDNSVVGPASLIWFWSEYSDPENTDSYSGWTSNLSNILSEMNTNDSQVNLSKLESAVNLIPAITSPTSSDLNNWNVDDPNNWLIRFNSGANRTDSLIPIVSQLRSVSTEQVNTDDLPRFLEIMNNLETNIYSHLAIQSLDHSSSLSNLLPSSVDSDSWWLTSEYVLVQAAVLNSEESAPFDSIIYGKSKDEITAELSALTINLENNILSQVNNEISVFSFSRFEIDNTSAIISEIGFLTSIASVILGTVLWTRLRSFRETFLILGVTGSAIIVTYGIASIAGVVFNPAMNAIPILMLALGVDYGLHVVMRFREEKLIISNIANSSDNLQNSFSKLINMNKSDLIKALTTSTIATSTVLSVAIITDFIGFSSYRLSSARFLQDFGITVAIGLLIAFLLSVTTLPAVLSIMKPRKFSLPNVSYGESKFAIFIGKLIHKPKIVLFVCILLTAPLLYSSLNLDVGFNPRDNFNDKLPIVQDFFILSDNFSRGEGYNYLVIDGDQFTSENMLIHNHLITMLSSYPELSPNIDSLWSRIQLSRQVNPELNNLVIAVENESSDDDWDSLKTYLLSSEAQSISSGILSSDGQQSVIRFQSPSLNYQDSLDLESSLSSDIAEISNIQYSIQLTGRDFIIAQITEDVARSSIISTVIVALIFLSMLVLINGIQKRDPIRGLIIGTPLILVVFWVYGTLGFLGIALNQQTIVIGALTLGLGIDYSVHIAGRIEEEFHSNPNANLSDITAFSVDTTGKAMLSAALTTAGGFALLGLSGIAPLRLFGQVFVLAIILAFLASIILVPTLISTRLKK